MLITVRLVKGVDQKSFGIMNGIGLNLKPKLAMMAVVRVIARKYELQKKGNKLNTV